MPEEKKVGFFNISLKIQENEKVRNGEGEKEVEIDFGLQSSWREKVMAHKNGKQRIK